MYAIDRMAAVIEPTEMMLQWLLENLAAEEITMEELLSDCTTILIPLFDEPSEAINYVNTVATRIFDNELASWEVDPKHWPDDRGPAGFWSWFHVEFHSLVFDAAVLDELEELEEENYSTTLQ